MASVVVQRVGSRVCVLDEIILNRASTRDACEEFHRRYPHHPGGVVVYGDASGNSQSTKGSSDYDIIKDFFRSERVLHFEVRVPKTNPPVRDRVGLVNRKLRNANGHTELYVDPKCKELILDFEQVTYVEDSTNINKTKDRKRTHVSDALGYLVWECFQTERTVGPQTQRLI
jgi:hypothetical protein